VSALTGVLTDPREYGEYVAQKEPEVYNVDDEGMILPPSEQPESVEVVRGPNIKPLPVRGPLEEQIEGKVLLKVGDNITTDHIMPAGSKILPLRSNIPAISEFVFVRVDPKFPARAKANGGGIIVAGANYGQGSSREHAALAPMYLGVKAIIAKSFARIHRANLINFGILPLIFANEADYDSLSQDDGLMIRDVKKQLEKGGTIDVESKAGKHFTVTCEVSVRQRDILFSGGLLNHVKNGEAQGTQLIEDAAVHLATSTMISTSGQFRPGRPKKEEVSV
jgi:aconitate hydratase